MEPATISSSCREQGLAMGKVSSTVRQSNLGKVMEKSRRIQAEAGCRDWTGTLRQSDENRSNERGERISSWERHIKLGKENDGAEMGFGANL